MDKLAAIFDLDCTLTDRTRSIAKFADRLAVHHSTDLAEGVTADAIARVITAADGFGYEPRQAVCAALAGQVAWRRPPTVDRLLRFWARTFPACAVARDGCDELLRALRDNGYRLGLISNGRGRTQRRKLRAMGLQDAFDCVLISEEVGLRKPDAAIFELALRQLGVTPARAWFVGDHPRMDVAGARDAGLNAVWFAGVHAWSDDLTLPAYVVHDLAELLPLLAASVSGQRPAGS